MELDKRIKAITDIQSVTSGCYDWKFMTKKGYFANSIVSFKDLDKSCVHGEYAAYREEEDRCFLCLADLPKGSESCYYAHFIPEDALNPVEPEKKYRPYTLAEWVNQHEIGEVIHFRSRDKDYRQEFHVMYTGYVIDNGEDIQDIRTTGRIMLINMGYLLQELFERYEICINGEWQPFGVLEE